MENHVRLNVEVNKCIIPVLYVFFRELFVALLQANSCYGAGLSKI